ncbi:MAG: J domain-containing protein [Cyanobacteria bacterium SBLK]|nr:J domain-containing protein [Cyanobacteria bacterium SBLK]
MSRKKSKPIPKVNHEIALSSFHFRFEELEKDHQWLLKQIKRKRKELTNFLEQMKEIAVEVSRRSRPFHEQLIELDREIHAVFEEIFTTRKFGKQSRKKIEKVYRMLQMMGLISPKRLEHPENEDEIDNEEFYQSDDDREEFNDDFNSGNSDREDNSPPEHQNSHEDLQQMRQSFLRLASIFHPDKVTDGEKKEDYEEIMKEVNRAYEEGDMARLLELERQYELEKSINLDNASGSEIERQCDRLEKNNQMLKVQYESIKSELRWMRRTPEGEMVKEYRSLVRQGFDPIEEIVAEAKNHIEEVEEIRDFVADFRDKKMSIKDFVRGPYSGQPQVVEVDGDMLDEILAELIRRNMGDF